MNFGQTHYPPTHGMPELRNAIAEYYQTKGVDQDASNVRIPLIRPVEVLERVAEGIERQLKRG